MINLKTVFTLIAVASLALAGTASAGEKTYRATGTILRVTNDMLLLRTSVQDLELKRDAKTKITGELSKSGAATVTYTKVGGNAYATDITVASSKK